MAVIESGRGVITQINVFKVEPEKVDLLVDVLKAAAHAVADIPGWMSISLHVALDKTQVTNYAQCSSKEVWDEVMEVLYTKGFITRIGELARPEPCLYEVEWTLGRDQPH
jgi:hypothetical protein